MNVDQVDQLELDEAPQEALPAAQILELARAQGLTRARGANLPRPEGLPANGWYQVRKLRTEGGLALVYRWAVNETDARPHELCPCGSGRLFGKCHMETKNLTIGRLN